MMTFDQAIEHIVHDHGGWLRRTISNLAYTRCKDNQADAFSYFVAEVYQQFAKDEGTKADLVRLVASGEIRAFSVRVLTQRLQRRGQWHQTYMRGGVTNCKGIVQARTPVDVEPDEWIEHLVNERASEEPKTYDRIHDLDGRDILRIMSGILSNKRAKERFTREELDLFHLIYLDDPVKKPPTIKSVATEIGVCRKTLTRSFVRIRKFLRAELALVDPQADGRNYLFLRRK